MELLGAAIDDVAIAAEDQSVSPLRDRSLGLTIGDEIFATE
jgi:hypothetical protein